MFDGRPHNSARRTSAVSPVIGIVLLVAVTVVLAGGSSVMFLQLADDPDPIPQTRFQFSYDADTNAVTVTHGGGDTVTATNTGELAVVIDRANGQQRVTWADTDGGVVDISAGELSAGNSITIDDATGADTGDRTVSVTLQQGDVIRLVWTAPSGESTAELTSDTVPSLAGGSLPILDGDGTVVTGTTANGGDGTAGMTVGPSGVQALGSLADIDSDGTRELPYVDTAGNLRLNDSDGETETLVDASSAPATELPDTDKTLLATGTWNGSDQSVFYANDDSSNPAMYRVSSGGSPTEVASLGANGTDSVLGIGDIDGDGTAELVYTGSSQEVRYLEPDGTRRTTGFTSGSDVGIGNGQLPDIDGDGTDEALVVDGSNDIRLLDANGPESTPAQSSVDAAKSPVTAADVDGDGVQEVVYIDDSSTAVEYIDDVSGSATVETLTDGTGSQVSGDKATGVVS